MIVYEMTDVINQHMSQGQVVVSSVSAKNNQLIVEIHDKIDNRYASIVFDKPVISTESFDITNQLVVKLAVYRYEKFYSTKRFIGAELIVANSANIEQTIHVKGSNDKGGA